MTEPPILNHQELPIGIVYFKQGLITKCNRCFQEMIGVSRELIGKSIEDLWDTTSLDKQTATVMSDHGNFDVAVRLKHRNKWVRVRHLVDQERASEEGLYLVEDVTSAHIKELVFDRIFRSYMDRADQSIFDLMVLTLTQVLGVNYCGIGIFQEKCSEVALRSISIRNELAPTFSYSLEGTPCKDILSQNQVVIKSGAREKYPLDLYFIDEGIDAYIATALRDKTGRIIAHLMVMDNTPIEDEKLVLSILDMCANRLSVEIEKEIREKELAISEAKYHHLFDQSFEAKLVYNITEARYENVNSAAVAMFGYSREEFIKLKPQDLVPPEDREDISELLQSVLKGIEGGQDQFDLGESRRLRADGTVFEVEIVLSRLHESFSGILVSIRDITERKEIESQLRAYRNNLENLVEERTKQINDLNLELSAKNEEVWHINQNLESIIDQRTETLRKQNQTLSDYAFSNSHKVRAPLANLIGLTDLINRTDLAQSELRELTTRIDFEVQRLDQILREINKKLYESEMIPDI